MIVANEYLGNLETYIMFRIRAHVDKIKHELIAKNRAPISLAMGAPVDMVPQFVVDELKRVLDDPSIHTYSTPKGEKKLREAICYHMEQRFGVKLDAENEVHSLIGSKEGIANMIRQLINPYHNDEDKEIIWTPDPGYASYSQMVLVSGGKSYGIPTLKEDNYMPDLDKVWDKFISEGNHPKKLRAIILNYPSNPLGATCTFEYMQKAVDFCKKHDVLLIYDNAYCDIYFDEANKPRSILECEGAKDIAVEFYSFSKPYAMTGWRLGWVCGNKETISAFGKVKSSLDTGVFKALQIAGANLLKSEEGEKYIKEANIGFKKKLEKFVDGLHELGWSNVQVPKATFYLWIETPKRFKSDEEFCEEVLETSGITIVPGTAFGECGKGYVRLSIVASEAELDEVINRMKKDGHTFEK